MKKYVKSILFVFLMLAVFCFQPNKAMAVEEVEFGIYYQTIEDVVNRNPCVFDKDNVILVSDKTHKIIHYAFSLDGIEDDDIVVRKPNDTRLW